MIEQLHHVDPGIIERLTALDKAAFGPGGLNYWHFVPLIRHGRVFIFRQGELVVGSVQYMRKWDQPDTAYMIGVTVDKEWRGQGIACRLLATSFQVLRRQSLCSIELTVAPDNVAALTLYEGKLGFSRTEYRENEYGPGEHRLVLTLALVEA